jgi:hypothetical protein
VDILSAEDMETQLKNYNIDLNNAVKSVDSDNVVTIFHKWCKNGTIFNLHHRVMDNLIRKMHGSEIGQILTNPRLIFRMCDPNSGLVAISIRGHLSEEDKKFFTIETLRDEINKSNSSSEEKARWIEILENYFSEILK